MTVDDLIPGREPSGLTRAELLRRSAFAAGVVTTGGVLAACSGGGGGGTAAASVPSADRAPLATTWQVSNWPHFIDTDSVYSEDIASNEAAAARYAPMLAEGEDIGQDAIVLSDWMAYQWIHAGYAQRLDPALLPHVNSLRIPPLRRRPIDP